MVWYMMLSPLGSAPLRLPRKAEKVPLCACAVEITGVSPVPVVRMIHGGKVPVSKPPLTRTQGPGVKGCPHTMPKAASEPAVQRIAANGTESGKEPANEAELFGRLFFHKLRVQASLMSSSAQVISQRRARNAQPFTSTDKPDPACRCKFGA